MSNPNSTAALALTSDICPSGRPPDTSWLALPSVAIGKRVDPVVSSDEVSIDVVVENGISMHGNDAAQKDAGLSAALEIGVEGHSRLEDPGVGVQFPLLQRKGCDADHGETMKAQGHKHCSMLPRKPALAATNKSTPKKVVSGSRFNVLNLDDDSSDPIVVSSVSQLRELVISAGSISIAKGKATGSTGVGSTLKKLPQEALSLVSNAVGKENKENADVNLQDRDSSVAKGLIVRIDSSLNRKTHMTVCVVEEGQRSVLRDVGDRSMSGPIRSSGVKSANRIAASTKSIYRQSPRMHKEYIKRVWINLL
ncbi:hypothetical protein V6N13_096044 [Hibiscus sabdariffa]